MVNWASIYKFPGHKAELLMHNQYTHSKITGHKSVLIDQAQQKKTKQIIKQLTNP